MSTEAQKRASIKYNAEKTAPITIRLNRKTDADILDKLKSLDNMQGYIKNLIREDMNKKRTTSQ